MASKVKEAIVAVLCALERNNGITAWNIQGGATVEAVDGWRSDTHTVTEHLPYSGWSTPSFPPFLWCRRMVEYVRHVSTPVCHIRWSKCHVCYWQDSEAKV